MNLAESTHEFELLLARGGLAAAIGWLNASVPHRYTAAYRIAAAQLHSVYVHDKRGELPPGNLSTVDLDRSFCQFAVQANGAIVADAASDPRLADISAASKVVAYCGVPIGAGDVDLFGTLCHFDSQARAVTDAQFALLEAAGQQLYPYLMAAGFPR
ncbi:MAG: hypothetical protein GAK38_01197 [Xylophilus sp.]|nr:MAG: hypothetical protein GAK38_01197 [Xylophilus sp.]